MFELKFNIEACQKEVFFIVKIHLFYNIYDKEGITEY